MAEITEDAPWVVLDTDIGEAQRREPQTLQRGVLATIALHVRHCDVVRAAVELDSEALLGPEPVDLPDIDVDVVLRCGDVWVLSEEAIEGELEVGRVVLGAQVGGKHRAEPGDPLSSVVARERRLDRFSPVTGIRSQEPFAHGEGDEALELPWRLNRGQLDEHPRDRAQP